jgi:hypothetical protein
VDKTPEFLGNIKNPKEMEEKPSRSQDNPQVVASEEASMLAYVACHIVRKEERIKQREGREDLLEVNDQKTPALVPYLHRRVVRNPYYIQEGQHLGTTFVLLRNQLHLWMECMESCMKDRRI